jgi:hypothetical protein
MRMLGLFENFPRTAHRITQYVSLTSNRSLQQRLTQTLHALNSQTFSLEKVTDVSIPECVASFEFGIAQANDFNYLDDDETETVMRTINRRPLHVMDFLCVVRYHRLRGEKKRALRFDYSLIRFSFSKDVVNAKVFHERGPRHTSPEDILDFIVRRVNEQSSSRALKEVV